MNVVFLSGKYVKLIHKSICMYKMYPIGAGQRALGMSSINIETLTYSMQAFEGSGGFEPDSSTDI